MCIHVSFGLRRILLLLLLSMHGEINFVNLSVIYSCGTRRVYIYISSAFGAYTFLWYKNTYTHACYNMSLYPFATAGANVYYTYMRVDYNL